jgi:L-cystine uptake protein TcyP (sodium:dicarboxylate symporter family)
MPDQNYGNHRQYVPIFHYVLLPVLFFTVIGSIVNLVESWGDHTRLYSASLIVVLSVCGLITAFFARVFSLKAQDRAIRADENLRHFAMTGKLLDARLTVPQVVGLRFASDAEFVALAQTAAAGNLTQDAIKRAIKTWRPDTYRV